MSKEWSWSYSKKKNFDNCPKRYYEVDVSRNFKETGEQLTHGNEVHKGLQLACEGKAPLPRTMAPYQNWVDVVRGTAANGGELLVEQKYALTRDLKPTAWYADDVWYRGICDLLHINNRTITAIDWKTGRLKHDATQLMLMALCLFAHYPDIDTVVTRYIWLEAGATTREEWTRKSVTDAFLRLLPEINGMEVAHKNMNFPPKPGGLCRRYCPVTSCPYHGKGA